MLNSNNERELAYVVNIDAIEPIVGSDNCEAAIVGGWRVMVRKETFKPGDLAIYFEIDSKVDTTRPEFAFLESKGGKIKTQRYTFGGKGLMISQGLLMSAKDFGWKQVYNEDRHGTFILDESTGHTMMVDDDSRFLTKMLNVTYAVAEDNIRKSNGDPNQKYKAMSARHVKLAKTHWWRWLMKREWGRKLLFFFFGKKKDKKNDKGWPVGRFPGVNKTDQERCENMPWILNDKTPFIKTQKCDGSSGTYILEKIPAKGLFGKDTYEFFVCSRNVRMMKEDQECFYGAHNYYWEVAKNYEIEKKMREWMDANPEATFVCWQGEICAPGIQKNPHNLSYTHFYCFHWTDSINGRRDIRDAAIDWAKYCMEVVPIVDTHYIMPDDFEEFKKSADGFYDSDVCEGHIDCAREGFVYYKTTDPNFSFKNVSREYLLKHNG